MALNNEAFITITAFFFFFLKRLSFLIENNSIRH